MPFGKSARRGRIPVSPHGSLPGFSAAHGFSGASGGVQVVTVMR